MPGYESVKYGFDGWSARTGSLCGCCNYTDTLFPHQAGAELRNVAEKYLAMGKRYARMADLNMEHDIPNAYARWIRYAEAKDNVETWNEVHVGRNCGTHGLEIYRHSLKDLLEEMEDARHAMAPEDMEIAYVFCWRE